MELDLLHPPTLYDNLFYFSNSVIKLRKASRLFPSARVCRRSISVFGTGAVITSLESALVKFQYQLTQSQVWMPPLQVKVGEEKTLGLEGRHELVRENARRKAATQLIAGLGAPTWCMEVVQMNEKRKKLVKKRILKQLRKFLLKFAAFSTR